MKTFIDRAKQLNDSLGPLLFQLPPAMDRDDKRLENFLIETSAHNQDIRGVIEFRHKSWMDDRVFDLIRKYDMAFCIFDMPGFSSPLITTAKYSYIRFHGHDDKYSSLYPDSELYEWASKIKDLSPVVDTIYIYFNNDAGGFAIQNAITLRKYLLE